MRRDQPVAWVDLGPSADIDRAIAAWRPGYGLGEEAQRAGATLRQKVWQPLEADFADAKTVLISPDGELAKFPWAALPGTKPGTYLIEEREIAVIPVPQALPELLAKIPATDAAPSLLLVGNVDYRGDAGKLSADNRGQRAVRDGQSEWPPLPGTKDEIARIGDSFRQRFAKGEIMRLDGGRATAAAVHAAAPNCRYLHFATHGFFADPSVRSALAPSDKARLAMFGELARRQVSGYHPGVLSGIVLAGANRRPENGKDDGILTALEVGELDLGGVELATLSACETGLGKTAGGEGILGLQRAFQTAGARSVVASLWKVPDHATQVLMDRFYDNLWNKKLGKLDSLMEAQAPAAARGREGSRTAPRRTRPGIPFQPERPLREIRPLAAPLLGRLRAFRRLAIGTRSHAARRDRSIRTTAHLVAEFVRIPLLRGLPSPNAHEFGYGCATVRCCIGLRAWMRSAHKKGRGPLCPAGPAPGFSCPGLSPR